MSAPQSIWAHPPVSPAYTEERARQKRRDWQKRKRAAERKKTVQVDASFVLLKNLRKELKRQTGEDALSDTEILNNALAAYGAELRFKRRLTAHLESDLKS